MRILTKMVYCKVNMYPYTTVFKYVYQFISYLYSLSVHVRVY